ncbi:slr1658 superfamily regulator [Leptospira vanthielii]|uniref:GHKL domain protein n=1 Tax=Leptospira vanthielii serovar Holland str. Waz Holland = ATCC 700522 TaxID=1218591 RepID=N1WC21_9LEPT|nr:ATP-binding protein [Leptospira vanthielii]EMY70970.1 GHKL domain protein [Leptospira vanthielii serovar Holland str. Waz Holland = ATCC 700522]
MSFVSLTSVKSTLPKKNNDYTHPNDYTNEISLLIERTNFLLEQKVFFHSHLSISVSSADMTFYWKRCDVLSNFISQFYFHSYESKRLDKNAISTIINELVENAAKYSDKENSKIYIEIKDLGTDLRLEVKNRVTPWMKAIFENKIQTIQEGNINQLYFDALESRNNGSGSDGMGLLILLKDYQLKLAYEFTKTEELDFDLTIRVHIPVEPGN